AGGAGGEGATGGAGVGSCAQPWPPGPGGTAANGGVRAGRRVARHDVNSQRRRRAQHGATGYRAGGGAAPCGLAGRDL
ncbi:hypothetical protein HaLaN_32066, partial [Haematococcus lacustris]